MVQRLRQLVYTELTPVRVRVGLFVSFSFVEIYLNKAFKGNLCGKKMVYDGREEVESSLETLDDLVEKWAGFGSLSFDFICPNEKPEYEYQKPLTHPENPMGQKLRELNVAINEGLILKSFLEFSEGPYPGEIEYIDFDDYTIKLCDSDGKYLRFKPRAMHVIRGRNENYNGVVFITKKSPSKSRNKIFHKKGFEYLYESQGRFKQADSRGEDTKYTHLMNVFKQNLLVGLYPAGSENLDPDVRKSILEKHFRGILRYGPRTTKPQA